MTSIIRIIAAIAMLFAGAAQADIKTKGASGTEFTIHTATVQYSTVEKFYVAEALITVRSKSGIGSRQTWAFINCDGPVGNAIRLEDGRIVERETWVAGGDSVIDDLAANTCNLAYIREAGDLLKELQTLTKAPKKNI